MSIETSAELKERLRIRKDLCIQYRCAYFGVIRLFGPTIHTAIVNRCNRRDMRLAVETEKAAVACEADGEHWVNQRLKLLLELQTILYEEYRDAYFSIINLIGAEIFNYVGDHHNQCDGVLEAEAAKIDDMIERIRHSAN